MIDIRYTPEFQKRYHELPRTIQEKAERQERLFRQNQFNPALSTEKLKPKSKEYWSFRIDRNYRIIFRYGEKGTIYFLTYGHHNWIYRYVISH